MKKTALVIATVLATTVSGAAFAQSSDYFGNDRAGASPRGPVAEQQDGNVAVDRTPTGAIASDTYAAPAERDNGFSQSPRGPVAY